MNNLMCPNEEQASLNRESIKQGIGDDWWITQENVLAQTKIDGNISTAILREEVPFVARRRIKPDKRWEDEEN